MPWWAACPLAAGALQPLAGVARGLPGASVACLGAAPLLFSRSCAAGAGFHLVSVLVAFGGLVFCGRLLLFSLPVGLCSCAASSAPAVFCVGLCCWVASVPYVCCSRFPACFPATSSLSRLHLFVTQATPQSNTGHCQVENILRIGAPHRSCVICRLSPIIHAFCHSAGLFERVLQRDAKKKRRKGEERKCSLFAGTTRRCSDTTAAGTLLPPRLLCKQEIELVMPSESLNQLKQCRPVISRERVHFEESAVRVDATNLAMS
jgi:hypothetical protein